MGSARQAARRSPTPATVPAAKTSDAGSARTRPRGDERSPTAPGSIRQGPSGTLLGDLGSHGAVRQGGSWAAVRGVLCAAASTVAGHGPHEQEQDSGADDGGDPGTGVEERVEGLHVEQRLGEEPAKQRTDNADDGGQQQAGLASSEMFSDDARDGAEHDPGDDAHEDLLAIGPHLNGRPHFQLSIPRRFGW